RFPKGAPLIRLEPDQGRPLGAGGWLPGRWERGTGRRPLRRAAKVWAQSHHYDSAPEVTVTDESRVGEALAADAKADAAADTPDEETDEATQAEATEEAPATRSEATDEFWQEVGVDPIKVALPRDVVGFTLRAYRPASQVTVEGESAAADEEDPFA